MATGVPATIAANLIDKLNSLRVRHTDDWGSELEQVRFSVRALKSADPGAYFAVCSMIAALSKNVVELESIAAQLTRRFDFTDRANVLLSLAVAGCHDQAWRLARELIQETASFELSSLIADCILTTGKLSRVLELARHRQSALGTPEGELPEERIVQALHNAGVDDEMFSEFLDAAKGALSAQGWVGAPILIAERLSSDDGGSGVLAKFMINADPERALEVEDAFMDSLIAGGEPLFVNGIVACTVSLSAGPNG